MPRLITFLLVALLAWPALASEQREERYRQWVEEMKADPRGPFQRLRWFCNDGSVLPPEPYACRGHGGGHQHGEWSERTETLRGEGYFIANLFAGLDPEAVAAAPDFHDVFGQTLVERFLIAADNGWIFRRALFYRGAIQEEDEREGARALLRHLAAQPQWADTKFLALRTAARLLPHGAQSGSAQAVRQASAALSDLDRAFMPVRAKIHGAPDAGDAGRVRDYARGVDDATLRARYLALADQIDAIYQARPLAEALDAWREALAGAGVLGPEFEAAARALARDDSAAGRFQTAAALLADVRRSFPGVQRPEGRVALLDLSLELESAHLTAAAELRDAVARMSRAGRLALLRASAQAAYGVGMLKAREFEAATTSVASLGNTPLMLADYLSELRYLGRVPGWATQNLRLHFFDSMQKLADIEPKAVLFIQDQLRGSPLLFFSQVLDGLLQDGNRLAGVRHRLFGEELGAGFNALNPGIAVGQLFGRPDPDAMESLDEHGIYVLPETVSDLPPIAGIMTAGEGNPLSHVQLLARNLGIPNVAVDEGLVPRLEARAGTRTVLAVSPSGLVELDAYGPAWAERLGHDEVANGVTIRPDLAKLDLSLEAFVGLDRLRATDSGRTVGPKAAKLGELRSAFPQAVAPGVAIPFGIFKAEVLDRPYRGESRSVFDWMVAQYRALEQLPDGSGRREAQTEAFRAELYDIILATPHSEDFRRRLRTAMEDTFGDVDTGVFVRSDTNVEDLPGFTGAGLNLTLPNVVGFDALLEAISRVWASPFTARAFAWRQSHMENPEHVYTSILLLRSVASDKSGVLVTQDLDTGDRAVLSVAVNEGLGGAVDGQAAESLRIDTRDGAVRVTATATAPWRRVPDPAGGIAKLPASGGDVVLEPAEIRRLIVFAREELPARFPPITDDEGRPAAADIEFGFLDGRLQLFQIRPFLESRAARSNAHLIAMDRALAGQMDRPVDLEAVPAP